MAQGLYNYIKLLVMICQKHQITLSIFDDFVKIYQN